MDEKSLADSPRRISGANESMAKREKTWDECGIEEKVERIRHQLRQLRDMSQYVARTASEAKEIAVSHQHNHATGEVLRPVQRHGGAEAGSDSRSFDPLR
jgi:hypothetical protein